MTYQRPTGWFADTTESETASMLWHPILQLPGICVPMEIWFETEADCEDFIRREILGQPMLEEQR